MAVTPRLLPLMPPGTRLVLLGDHQRSSISGRPLPPIPSGEVLTVIKDFGGGRINVHCDFLGQLSEIVYISELVIDTKPVDVTCNSGSVIASN